MNLGTSLKNLHQGESGRDLSESALIAAVKIDVACIAAVGTLATAMQNEFANVGSELT